MLENILEGEMEEYLGRNKYERQTKIDTEYRNYQINIVKRTYEVPSVTWI